jgi:hypothetical protein
MTDGVKNFRWKNGAGVDENVVSSFSILDLYDSFGSERMNFYSRFLANFSGLESNL